MSAVVRTVMAMELLPATLEPLGRHLTDAQTYDYAPMPLYGAMLYLNAGREVVASVCRSRSSEDQIAWRVAWLTGDLLGYATVSKQAPSWDAESGDQEPDDSEAWVRPIKEVVQLGIRLLNHRHAGSMVRERWVSDPCPVVTWADGAQLALPLFDGVPEAREREAIDAFATALRSRLWRQVPASS